MAQQYEQLDLTERTEKGGRSARPPWCSGRLQEHHAGTYLRRSKIGR